MLLVHWRLGSSGIVFGKWEVGGLLGLLLVHGRCGAGVILGSVLEVGAYFVCNWCMEERGAYCVVDPS